MTVGELAEALEALPQDDEVRLYDGLGPRSIKSVYHEITYANHYVVIS